MKTRYFIPILLATTLFAFQNCSDDVPTGNSQTSSLSSNGSPNPSLASNSNLSLSFSPSAPTSVDTITLAGSGGSPGYTYTKLSGGGTLASNIYAPPATGGAAQFEITDAAGRKSSINVNVSSVATVTVYRFVIASGQVYFHNDPSGTAFAGKLGAVAAGSIKLFQGAITGSVPVTKCARSGLDYLGNVYFTTAACAAGYSSLGTFGYASSSLRPNTAAAAAETSINGYLPNY